MSVPSISEEDIKGLALRLLNLNVELYVMPVGLPAKAPSPDAMMAQLPGRLAVAADDAVARLRDLGLPHPDAEDLPFAGDVPANGAPFEAAAGPSFQALVAEVDTVTALGMLAAGTGEMVARAEQALGSSTADTDFAEAPFASGNTVDAGAVEVETARLKRIQQDAVTLFAFEQEGVREQRPAEALLAERKIWETLDQRPLIKTIIQMDGDIVTQVDVQQSQALLAVLYPLHMGGVSAAIQYWGALAGVLSDFLSSVVRTIFRRG